LILINTAEDVKALALAADILLEIPSRCSSRHNDEPLSAELQEAISETAKVIIAKIKSSLI